MRPLPLAVILATALAGSSCASQPALKLTMGEASEWKPNENFMARIELQEQDDSYKVRLDMTRSLVPCMGYREDGILDMEAMLTLEEGTEVNGPPVRVTPEFGDTGTFRARVDVSFPMAASRSRAKLLKLRVQREQAAFRIVMEVY